VAVDGHLALADGEGDHLDHVEQVGDGGVRVVLPGANFMKPIRPKFTYNILCIWSNLSF
jgi:hypothetical protein